ncbi:DinB family protein [Priestia koreensis]|uniref:Damage-inducible protein DinB n=1 Tax=Priestia koreensis TaxID=284581 RepID=A0A0M0L6F7_9BACI|nr:DinB family protein [Priestia koreensis]KOO46656.1 damage-inducible protein DinB [Priestia koreensis]
MLKFFDYNWQVRDEWFDWCKQLDEEELFKKRSGGVGSILYTLFHIVDVEYSWIRGIGQKEDVLLEFESHRSIQQIKHFSDRCREEITEFLLNWDGNKEKMVTVPWDDTPYMVEDIIQHVIAHEIHHTGQLSVWARELHLEPVSANVVGRSFQSFKKEGSRR